MSRLQSGSDGSQILRFALRFAEKKSRFFRDFMGFYYTYIPAVWGRISNNRSVFGRPEPSSCFIKSCPQCFHLFSLQQIQTKPPLEVLYSHRNLRAFDSQNSGDLKQKDVTVWLFDCLTVWHLMHFVFFSTTFRIPSCQKVLVSVYESLKTAVDWTKLQSSGCFRSRIFLWSGLGFDRNDSGFVNMKFPNRAQTDSPLFQWVELVRPGHTGLLKMFETCGQWMRTMETTVFNGGLWQLACNWRFKSWGSLGTIQESTADERKRINLNLKEETERLSFEIWNHCNPNTQKCNVERFCSNLHDIAKYHTQPPGGAWVSPATTSPRTRAEFEGSLHHAAGFHVPLPWHHTGNLGPLRPWMGSKWPPWQGPKVLSVTIDQCVSQSATSHNLHPKTEKFCLSLRTSMPMRKNGCPQSTS